MFRLVWSRLCPFHLTPFRVAFVVGYETMFQQAIIVSTFRCVYCNGAITVLICHVTE